MCALSITIAHEVDDVGRAASLFAAAVVRRTRASLRAVGELRVNTQCVRCNSRSKLEIAMCDERAMHCRRYDEDGLRTLLERSGYRVEYLTQFLGSLYPLMWLSRHLLRWRRADDPLQEELRIRPGVNAALTAILSWEARQFIARRRRLPIGTSRLAMARPVNALG